MNNTENREILQIPLEEIIPNRFQPRLTFDIDALNDLARSIKEHGIIQPLVVRRMQDKYEIVAGERRFKAASMIGMKTVPCIVMNLNDGQSAEVAIIENIQRKDMTPLEEAKSFKQLLDKGYLTQDDLAKKMGKSQSSIANKLRLLNLDELVQDAILNNKISERHARSILRIQNKETQRIVLNEILQGRLTVKQTDDLINEKYSSSANLNEFIAPNEVKTEAMNNNNVQREAQTNMSMPEVKLPGYGKSENSNPQLKILNSLGKQNNNTYEENMSSVVTNDLPDESTNPALNIFRFGESKMEYKNNEEINNNNLLNPSNLPEASTLYKKPMQDPIKENEEKDDKLLDLSELEPASTLYKKQETPVVQENKDEEQLLLDPSTSSTTPELQQKDENVEEIPQESQDLNIEEIKQNAQDIIKEEKPLSDIETLLQTEEPIRENKFLVGLEKQEKASFIDVEDSEPNYKRAKNQINKEIDNLKSSGVKLYKEEADFGSTLQIIIRIEK